MNYNPVLGKLILFPVSIGNKNLSTCLPEYNISLLNQCTHFIVEDVRTARRFLKEAGYTTPIDNTVFYLLDKHSPEKDISLFLHPLKEGKNIGILSESGLPCIADPGALVVAEAQKRHIEIIPLVGPSSLLLALMASGFNGQNFAFIGYLPIDKGEKAQKIKDIENLSYKTKQTQIFIETPYRNNQLLNDLISICHPQTLLCIASDIMLDSQLITTKSIKDWKKQQPDLNKRNTVFLLYRN